MGGCCGKEDTSASAYRNSNAAAGKRAGTAISPMGGAGSTAPATTTAAAAATGPAASPKAQSGHLGSAAAAHLLSPQAQAQQRAREKAVHALVESFKENESVVPSQRWRRQYVKVPGTGPMLATAIAERLKSARAGGQQQPPHAITTLDLRALKIGDDGVAALAPVLALDVVVENVILSGNVITDAGARALALALQSAAAKKGGRCPCRLKLLVLSDNPITADGIGAVVPALGQLPELSRVEIGRGHVSEDQQTEDDHLSEETVRGLVRLTQQAPSLQTLVFKGTGNLAVTDFSPNGLATFVTEVVGAGALASLFLQECYTTRPYIIPVSVVQGGGRKGGGGANRSPVTASSSADLKLFLQPIIALAAALEQPTTALTTLVLRFALTDAAVSMLCNGIAKAARLENLSLRGCEMSAAGLRILAGALRSNRTIAALDISYQSNLIAHPAVLAELRNSSQRRHSFYGYSEAAATRDSVGSSGTNTGTDSLPSREEREHPLLPVIQVLHTNLTISQLIMLGVNISTDDIEELCSCVEQSNNHVLTDVAYTSTGAEALNLKLENFLSANREYCQSVGVSAVSQRSLGRNGSFATLLGDTVTERSVVSDSPRPSMERPNGGGFPSTPPPAMQTPPLRPTGRPPPAAAAAAAAADISLEDVELRVGGDGDNGYGGSGGRGRRVSLHDGGDSAEHSESATAPYFSRTGRIDLAAP